MLAVAPLIGFIPVRDLAAARRFYEDRVGLIIVEETPIALVSEAAGAGGGGAMIRIVHVPEFQPQPFTILGWAVPDIQRALARLRNHGIDATRYEGMEQDAAGVWTAPGGDLIAWFTDPDGNVLSLTQFVTADTAAAERWTAGWSAAPSAPGGPRSAAPNPFDAF